MQCVRPAGRLRSPILAGFPVSKRRNQWESGEGLFVPHSSDGPASFLENTPSIRQRVSGLRPWILDDSHTQRYTAARAVRTLTAPAIAAILLTLLLGLRTFGHLFFVYYALAAITLAWQWYAVVLPGWKKWLGKKGVEGDEAELLAHRAGLAWLGESAIGPFAFHTTGAAVCGIHFGPWLLSRWFVWILPLAGMSTRNPTGDEYLQNFEVASIVPALVLGYLLSRHFQGSSTFAWILPMLILVYKLLTFTDPNASIIAPSHSSSRF